MMLGIRRNEFFNCTRPECKQRRFLHLATPASKLSRKDEDRLRAQNNLGTFVLEMLPLAENAVPPPYHLAYSPVGNILQDPEEMPNLERIQILGNQFMRFPGEDQLSRLVPPSLLDGIGWRCLDEVLFKDVNIPMQCMKHFIATTRSINLDFDTVVVPLNDKPVLREVGMSFVLSECILTLTLKGLEPMLVKFFVNGIRPHHDLHLRIAADGEDGLLTEGLWRCVAEPHGMAGIKALSIVGQAHFDSESTIYRDLFRSNVEELSIEQASFERESYQQFLQYVGCRLSPLRRLHIRGFNVIEGYGGNELKELFIYLKRGYVKWFAFTDISCDIAEVFASWLPDLELEACHLEIIYNEHKCFPATQLLDGVRMNYSLGKFTCPRREAKALREQIDGFSALGLHCRDGDRLDNDNYIDIFNNDQLDELHKYYRRNQRDYDYLD